MKWQLTRGVIANKTTTLEEINKDPCQKTFNLDTYKYHLLSDYTSTIHRFETTNSDSTTTICRLFCTDIVHSCLHNVLLRGNLGNTPKSCYLHTDCKAFVKQLTKIEQWQKCLRRIKQRMTYRFNPLEKVSISPEAHHHIGKSQNQYISVEDPAIKVVNLFY